MRVLAVGCHPDDLEINCFGTIARYVSKKSDVFICNVANGCMGHMEIPPDELSGIRKAEAQRAAEIVGAREYFNLGVNDLEVDSRDRKVIDAMVDIIRYTKPDVIITHAGDDYMRDHNEVHDLVFNASFMSSIPHYVTEHPVHPTIPPVYFMEPSAGNGFAPTDYVDITETLETKLKALACHESQVDWLRDHVGKDVLETTRATAIYRGKLCGARYAEAFLRCDKVLRMTPSRLLP
jgi:LmbE family N-acetylglucosaminyl deacetylase